MNKTSFAEIVKENNIHKCMSELAFLKTIQIKNKEDMLIQIQDVEKEVYYLTRDELDDDRIPHTKTGTASELVYHRMWNKLKKFHHINRITHYINSLEHSNDKLVKKVLKAFEDKLFAVINLSVQTTTSKKNKFLIVYNKKKKIYETDF